MNVLERMEHLRHEAENAVPHSRMQRAYRICLRQMLQDHAADLLTVAKWATDPVDDAPEVVKALDRLEAEVE